MQKIANAANPRTDFVKENYDLRMCRALDADLEFWLWPFLMKHMDAKGFVMFSIPLVCVIHDLTGLQKETIRRKLRELADKGEIERFEDDDNKIRVNPDAANRQGKCFDSDLAYEGKPLYYSPKELAFLSKHKKYVDESKQKHAEVQNMNASQELIDLKRQLKEKDAKISFLEGRIEGQRDVFRMGVSTAISTGMDKAQDILEREDEKPAEELIRKAPKLQAVKNEDGKNFEARH